MAALALYALPGIVVSSALGALIIAILLLRYGFTPDAEEDPDEADHRLFVLRCGHALVAMCFACAAILAVFAWTSRPGEPSRVAAAVPTPTAEGPQPARVTAEIARIEDRLNREVATLEERLSAVESSSREASAREVSAREAREASAREAAQRAAAAPQPSLPPIAEWRASRPPERARRGTVPEREVEAALPSAATASRLQATVQGTHVNLESRPGRGAEIVYTIRLSDGGTRPLNDAEVSLHGLMRDGSSVSTPLEATPEPGVYRGRIVQTGEGPRDLRLRVVGRDRRFELALSQAVSW